MAEKNDDKIDLTEIRRMIGEDTVPDQQFSLDEIISEVKDEEKKEKIERRKKEEKDAPFLSLMHETGEFDALDISETASPYVFPKITDESAADLPPAREAAPAEETDGKEEPLRGQAAAEPEKARTEIKTAREEEPGTGTEDDISDTAGKTAQKAYSADFDRTEFDTAEEAAVYYKKREVSLYLRAFFAFLLALSGLYLTLAPTFAFPLFSGFSYYETPFLYIFVLILPEVICILLALDLVVAGLYRLLTGRPTIYSLVALSSIATLFHAFTILVFPKWGGYLPFTSLSSMLIFFMLLSAAQKKGVLRQSFKVQTLSVEPVFIKIEKDAAGGICIFKAGGESAEEYETALFLPDPVDRFCMFYVPCAVVASFVFAAVATIGQKRPELFFWALSEIITISMPWALLIAYSAPAKAITKKLLSFGAGLPGWSSAKEISSCRRVVLTDMDLFPAKTVAVSGIKVFSPYTVEKVLSYAGSAIAQSDMGLKKVFADLMREQYITPCAADNLKFFESGGIAATIRGDNVLIGTPTFLLRMGVRINEGIRVKNGVFVAINASLAGVFALKYEAAMQVRNALRLLKRLRVVPIAAVRDFNLTPGMLENKFKLKPQWIDYPEIDDRLALSDPDYGTVKGVSAVLSRDGIVPLSECIALGKKLYRAARSNIIVGASGGVIGMLLMFYLTFHAAVSAATVYNTGAYMLLWLVPILLTSFGASRY